MEFLGWLLHKVKKTGDIKQAWEFMKELKGRKEAEIGKIERGVTFLKNNYWEDQEDQIFQ